MKLLGIEMPLEEFDYLMCEQSKGKELKIIDDKVVAVEYVAPQMTYEEKIEYLRAKREIECFMVTSLPKYGCFKGIKRGPKDLDFMKKGPRCFLGPFGSSRR